jgi:hypothetical protein
MFGQMTPKVYWLVATAIYSFVAFQILWNFAGPDPGDGYGSGYTPGLILTGLIPPSVSILQYKASQYIRFQYRVSYFVLAVLFACFGGVAPALFLNRFAGLRAKHCFPIAVWIGFVLLFLVPVLLDTGTRMKIWSCPTWFTWSAWMIYEIEKVFLPLALLSGFVAAGAKRVGLAQHTNSTAPDRTKTGPKT